MLDSTRVSHANTHEGDESRYGGPTETGLGYPLVQRTYGPGDGVGGLSESGVGVSQGLGGRN